MQRCDTSVDVFVRDSSIVVVVFVLLLTLRARSTKCL